MANLTQEQVELRDLIDAGKVSGAFAVDIATKTLVSNKQHDWVTKLINEAKDREVAQAAKATREATAEVLDTQRIADMFAVARKAGLSETKLKVRLMLNGTTLIRLSAAKSTSKNPGAIYVTRGDEREYMGKVTADGKLLVDDADIAALLREFAANPEVVAAKYGKLTDACSFCGLTLSDARSMEVGYGPICAKHWGLAWG